MLCQPLEYKELEVEADGGKAPKLSKPSCTGGDCDCGDCLAAKLEKLRACNTEFSGALQKIRYRKYVKMPRTRNDGSEYHETEFVYVEEPQDEFVIVSTMLSAAEAAIAHRGGHYWAVRQKVLVIEKLRKAGALEQLPVPGCTTVEKNRLPMLLLFEWARGRKQSVAPTRRSQAAASCMQTLPSFRENKSLRAAQVVKILCIIRRLLERF